jgi:hypothetical protein
MRSGSVELPDGGLLAFDIDGVGPDVVLLHPGSGIGGRGTRR